MRLRAWIPANLFGALVQRGMYPYCIIVRNWIRLRNEQKESVELAKTPILDALMEMVRQLRVPLHVPGHKQGRMLPAELAAWLGQAGRLDLTELPGLDNLHQPEECILHSQRLAAEYYGSQHCFYSVNGSSAAVMAAICSVAAGRKILLAGPFHQSAWRGIVLADAEPVILPTSFHRALHRPNPPAVADVAAELAKHPDCAAVFVTSPNYQGAVADVAALADVCHRAGVPLVVDEAHGAHFGLIPELPPHSVAAGADVVIHSAHKMLPALTQTAWVHVTGPRVDAETLQRWLLTFQTTSPSYLLLASLDAAQAWLRSDGPRAAAEALAVVRDAGIVVAGQTGVDPLRHWLPTSGLSESLAVQAALADAGIQVEMADGQGVLAVFGFGIRPREAERYMEIVRQTVSEVPPEAREDEAAWSLPALAPDFACRPRAAYGQAMAWVPLAEAEGRTAGVMVTPYPPGTPLIVPGQRLDAAAVATLRALLAQHVHIHGMRGDRVGVLCHSGAATG